MSRSRLAFNWFSYARSLSYAWDVAFYYAVEMAYGDMLYSVIATVEKEGA